MAVFAHGALKQNLISQGRVADLNTIYGWELSNDGKWPIERLNDIVFEIVMSPRYDQRRFLAALEKGAPFLRRLRERNCLDRFNSKYHSAIPPIGGLSFPEAEKFLYSVVGVAGFNPERTLSELCRGTVPIRSAAAEDTPRRTTTAVDDGTTAAAAPAPPSPEPRPNVPFLVVLAGGIVPLTLVVLLIRSIARDLRVKRAR